MVEMTVLDSGKCEERVVMKDWTLPVGEVCRQLTPLGHGATHDGGGRGAEDEAKEPEGVVRGGDIQQADEPRVRAHEGVAVTVCDHISKQLNNT